MNQKNLSEEKLIRIARKLSDKISDVSTPTDLYIKFISEIKSLEEYFVGVLGLKNCIKVIIYIWYLKNGNLKSASKAIENLEFVTLLSSEGEEAYESCSECGGDGTVDCRYCKGEGVVECIECTGTGTNDCNHCGGDGEIDGEQCPDCNGTGQEDCIYCDGGYVECDYCNGRSFEDCSRCEGTGEEFEGKLVIELTKIVTWNKFLVQKCDEIQQTFEELFITDKLLDYEAEYILLSLYPDAITISPEINLNTYYVVESNDDPDLYLRRDRIRFDTKTKSMEIFSDND